jgi:FtsP/CotA-like multicopper oxidase with cupredoxin domain
MSMEVCVDGANVFVPGVTPPLCAKGSAPTGPLMAQLGTMAGTLPVPQAWDAPITETPPLGATEVWEIFNFTADAHPIHLHMVMFQVANRQVIGGAKTRPPEPWESGFKDTVIAYPGEITRVKAVYDIPGLFVWHCHILSHEDNEMMRPYCVGDPAACSP